MDICQAPLREFNSEINELEMIIRIIVAAVTISLLCCICCCCFWINGNDPIAAEFDSHIVLQEIEDIEQQSEDYEEELRRSRKRRRRQLGMIEEDNTRMTSDQNEALDIRSDSWDALEESYIDDYTNEYVVINSYDREYRKSNTLNNTEDSDLSFSGGDVKDVSNVSKDSDVKPTNADVHDKNGNPETSHQVEKLCDTSNEKIEQCSQDDCDKSNDEGNEIKCDVANDSSKVDTEYRKDEDNSES